MPLVQDRSLNLLASSPACYHCTTDAPAWIWESSMPNILLIQWGSSCYRHKKNLNQEYPQHCFCEHSSPSLLAYHIKPHQWSLTNLSFIAILNDFLSPTTSLTTLLPISNAIFANVFANGFNIGTACRSRPPGSPLRPPSCLSSPRKTSSPLPFVILTTGIMIDYFVPYFLKCSFTTTWPLSNWTRFPDSSQSCICMLIIDPVCSFMYCGCRYLWWTSSPAKWVCKGTVCRSGT